MGALGCCGCGFKRFCQPVAAYPHPHLTLPQSGDCAFPRRLVRQNEKPGASELCMILGQLNHCSTTAQPLLNHRSTTFPSRVPRRNEHFYSPPCPQASRQRPGMRWPSSAFGDSHGPRKTREGWSVGGEPHQETHTSRPFGNVSKTNWQKNEGKRIAKFSCPHSSANHHQATEMCRVLSKEQRR